MFEAAPPVPLNSGFGGDCLEVKGCLPPADGLGVLGDHWSRTHIVGVIAWPWSHRSRRGTSFWGWGRASLPKWCGV